MRQTRKGKQPFFGTKLHIGVDGQTGLAHRAVVTAADAHDKHPLPDLLHGHEQQLWGDYAYARQQALISAEAPAAQDLTHRPVRKGSLTEALERARHQVRRDRRLFSVALR